MLQALGTSHVDGRPLRRSGPFREESDRPWGRLRGRATRCLLATWSVGGEERGMGLRGDRRGWPQRVYLQMSVLAATWGRSMPAESPVCVGASVQSGHPCATPSLRRLGAQCSRMPITRPMPGCSVGAWTAGGCSCDDAWPIVSLFSVCPPRSGTPGDFGFKVLTSSDPAEKRKKLSAEIANGRHQHVRPCNTI